MFDWPSDIYVIFRITEHIQNITPLLPTQFSKLQTLPITVPQKDSWFVARVTSTTDCWTIVLVSDTNAAS